MTYVSGRFPVALLPVSVLVASSLSLPTAAHAVNPCVPNTNIVTALACTTNGDLSQAGGIFALRSAPLDLTVRQGDTVNAINDYTIFSYTSQPISILNNGTMLAGNGNVVHSMGQLSITNNGTMSTAASGYDTINLQGASYGTITNNATGVISNTGDSAGVGFYSTSPNASTITNRGQISSSSYAGIYVSYRATANLTINNYGLISAGSNGYAAILQEGAGSKLTVNVYPGARFEGPVGVSLLTKTFTGNTINFYTANYSLSVANFLYGPGQNTVNALSPGSVLSFSGDAGRGTGTLIVATPAPTPAPAMPVAVHATASAVQSTLQVPVPTNYVPPVPPIQNVQNIAPDVQDLGGVIGNVASVGAMSVPSMSNLGLRGTQQDDMPSGNAERFDRQGNLVWGRAFGAARFQPSNDAVAGNINRTAGVLLGADRQFTNWRLGAYVGYGLSHTSLSDNSGKLASDLYLGGFYARTKIGGYTLTGNLAGGLLDNNSSRFVTTATTTEIARGSYGGAFFAPDLTVGYDIGLGKGWTLTPSLRGRYIGTYTRDYVESGSSQNIAFQTSYSNALEERAELRLSNTQRMPFGELVSTYVQGAAVASQHFGSGSLGANLAGTEITIQNGGGSVAGVSIGAGVDLALTQQLNIYAGADATEYTDASKTIAGRLGLRLAF